MMDRVVLLQYYSETVLPQLQCGYHPRARTTVVRDDRSGHAPLSSSVITGGSLYTGGLWLTGGVVFRAKVLMDSFQFALQVRAHKQ